MAFADQGTRDRPGAAARTESDEAMSGERVLVVDDEPIVSEVVQRYLIREGYTVPVAADGRAAPREAGD
jgi:hypothetical protein